MRRYTIEHQPQEGEIISDDQGSQRDDNSGDPRANHARVYPSSSPQLGRHNQYRDAGQGSIIRQPKHSEETDEEEFHKIPNELVKQAELEIRENKEEIEKLQKNKPSNLIIAACFTAFTFLCMGMLQTFGGGDKLTALEFLQKGQGGMGVIGHEIAFNFALVGMILPLLGGLFLMGKRIADDMRIQRLRDNIKINSHIKDNKVTKDPENKATTANRQELITQIIEDAQKMEQRATKLKLPARGLTHPY